MSSKQSTTEEHVESEKENNLPDCTPVVSKIPRKKKPLNSNSSIKGSSRIKQPFAIVNKH